LENSASSASLRYTSDYSNIPQGDIRFEGVCYAYDGERQPALNGVTFDLTQKKRTALIGPTGSGKSTLAYLLLRFMEPQAGAMTVDGIRLDELSARDWRSRIAWVPQNPYLFHDTVIANIRVARPDAPLDDVARAAQHAHADEFIRALPDGYETIIGERGVRLSGGQAQRIALARAFLKDAPIVILDEATSNLDAESEAQIQATLEELMQNRTVLIITHRLNTIARADRIVVLGGGCVLESGSHAELLDRQNHYHRLMTAAHMANVI
jgi:ABC-type multidrug transport system fused ATPase/permease subunit